MNTDNPGAPRFDMYTPIHKALRALMADTLLAVGRMDVDDELEFAQVTQRVLELLEFCAGHVAHEDQFVHPVLEARVPGSSREAAAGHRSHEQEFQHLSAAVAALRAAPAAQRPAKALALYRELALFIAGNFEHMHVEETAHNAALWGAYTDQELVAAHDQLLAAIPPDEMMFTVRWLVPFMNPAERAGMLGAMRAAAPAPAFQAVVDTVRPHLTQREWSKLQRQLA